MEPGSFVKGFQPYEFKLFLPNRSKGILKNTPPIKDTFDSIYEIYTNKIINIDNDEFIKHFEESQK